MNSKPLPEQPVPSSLPFTGILHVRVRHISVRFPESAPSGGDPFRKGPAPRSLIQIEGIIAYPLSLCGSRRRPILPDRSQSSTFGAKRLNFCVRYGYRWFPPAIVTGILSDTSLHLRSLPSLLPPGPSLASVPRTLKTAQYSADLVPLRTPLL